MFGDNIYAFYSVWICLGYFGFLVQWNALFNSKGIVFGDSIRFH